MSKLDSLSEEEKRNLKTLLSIDTDAKLDEYLKSTTPLAFKKKLDRIEKTDTPTLNRGMSHEGIDFDPMMKEDILKAKFQEENIKLYKAFMTHNKKFGLKTTPPPLKRGVSYETGFSYDPETEAREDFTSIPKHKSNKTTVGGKSKKYRNKNKRRSTRRRR